MQYIQQISFIYLIYAMYIQYKWSVFNISINISNISNLFTNIFQYFWHGWGSVEAPVCWPCQHLWHGWGSVEAPLRLRFAGPANVKKHVEAMMRPAWGLEMLSLPAFSSEKQHSLNMLRPRWGPHFAPKCCPCQHFVAARLLGDSGYYNTN